MSLPVPAPYLPGEDFARWLQGCEYYMTASNITTGPRKAATLLTLLGLEVQELVSALPRPDTAPAAASEYDILTLKLKGHYAKHVNVTFERSQLQGLSRNDGESFEAFVARLRLRAARCNYDLQQREDTILQCAVSRCRDKELQMKFFRTPQLTLAAAVQMAAEEEATRALVSELNALPPPSQSAAPPAPDPPPASAVHAVSDACWRCRSRRHVHTECPFRNARCYSCSRRGHTRAACSGGRPAGRAAAASAGPRSAAGDSPPAPVRSVGNSPAGAGIAGGGGGGARDSRRREGSSGRARSAQCMYCGRDGHWAVDCYHRQREAHATHRVGDTSEDSSAGVEPTGTFYNIRQLGGSASPAPVEVDMLINGTPVTWEVDTGASRSVMSEALFQTNWPAAASQITAYGGHLKTYTGHTVPVTGTAIVRVQYGTQSALLPVLLARVDGPPLLGRDWLQHIVLDWHALFRAGGTVRRVENSRAPPPTAAAATPPDDVTAAAGAAVAPPAAVRCAPDSAGSARRASPPAAGSAGGADLSAALRDLKQEFGVLFEPGLGHYNVRRVHLEVDTSVTPRFFKHRPPPFALREAIETEIDRQVSAGILRPVESSRWAAPVVPVKKRDGSVRLCGSYDVTVNVASPLERYPLPRVEELFTTLSGGRQFTKIDLAEAYLQFELDEASQEYVTLNTHKGLFRPTRLCYGVKSAVSIFQREIETLLSGIPSTAVYLDDICVTGSCPAEHIRNVRLVLERLARAGLKVNQDKCVWLADQVEYLGYSISAAGVQPTSEKSRAVLDAPEPTNLRQLRSYLGMLQYYGRFLPHLATVAAPLYALQKKEAVWSWEASQRRAFAETKRLLASAPVLAHYDPTQPLILTTDASPYGVAAVLSHPEAAADRPIAYASRSLCDAERNYSHLDKEACGVMFGLAKFHQFLYARSFIIKTDHQPLLALLGGDKALPLTVSPRILRYRLKLAGYQYKMVHVAGRSMSNADGLSRLPLPEAPVDAPPPADVVKLMDDLAAAVDVSHVRTGTRRDPTLSAAYRHTSEGWPAASPSAELQAYFRRRTELSLQDGCLLWGSRVVIPPSLRDNVLRLLHDGHPGIAGMKRLARCSVWWPGIDADIESRVRACDPCQTHRASSPENLPQPWPYPDKPWSRVHVDFAGPVEGRYLFIAVDAYSKWPEVQVTHSTSTAATIEALRQMFGQHGLPTVLVSDNATAFTSAEFKDFLSINGIMHKLTPPRHPASNGQAEVAVKIVKAALKRRHEGSLQTRLSRFLLAYRTTPHSTTGRPPAELLVGRHLRTRLDLLRPDLSATVQRRQQAWRDRRALQSSARDLRVGDRVYVSQISPSPTAPTWVQAELEAITGQLCRVRLPDGRSFVRHRDHVRPRYACTVSEVEPSPPPVAAPASLVSAPVFAAAHPGPVQPPCPEQPVSRAIVSPTHPPLASGPGDSPRRLRSGTVIGASCLAHS